MNKEEILRKITDGAKELKILTIEYKEKDGSNEGQRSIEPYSMRDAGTEKEALFGFDITKQGIRRFTLSRILNVKVSSVSFTPRNAWSVEF